MEHVTRDFQQILDGRPSQSAYTDETNEALFAEIIDIPCVILQIRSDKPNINCLTQSIDHHVLLDILHVILDGG